MYLQRLFRRVVIEMELIPKWYGIVIVILYSLFLAEFVLAINQLSLPDNTDEVFIILSKVNYVITILSGIVVWIVSAFIFHLAALLFDGKASFGKFLHTSSFPYAVPTIAFLFGLFFLDSIQISATEEIIPLLQQDITFNRILLGISLSFILYYLILIFIISSLYKIKIIYATFSIIIPSVSIWLISRLF